MWKRQRILAVGAACILSALCRPIYAAESLVANLEDWVPLELAPESFNALLGEVNVNGPTLINQEFTPYRAQGVLEGCGFSYQVLLKDWAYRSDLPTVVYGSIAYFLYPDRVPFLSLRIGLRDIEQREDRLWQRNSSVNYAYMRHEQGSTAGSEHQVVDGEEGAKNFVFVDPELEKITWLLAVESLTVGFNREPNRSDLEFDIPVMFTEVWQELGGCFKELSGL